MNGISGLGIHQDAPALALQLHQATKEGDLKTMCQLLDKHSVILFKLPGMNDNPFHVAAARNQSAALEVLLGAFERFRKDHPTAINNPLDEWNHLKRTPLEEAFQPKLREDLGPSLIRPNRDCALALLKAGAALFTHRDSLGRLMDYPLTNENVHYHKPILSIMKENTYQTVHEQMVRHLLTPLLHNDIHTIILSYDDMSGGDQFLKALHPDEWTGSPMEYASRTDLEFVKFLIDLGYDVDRPVRLWWYIPSYYAVQRCRLTTPRGASGASILPEAVKILEEAPAKKEKWNYLEESDIRGLILGKS